MVKYAALTLSVTLDGTPLNLIKRLLMYRYRVAPLKRCNILGNDSTTPASSRLFVLLLALAETLYVSPR